MAKVVAWRFLRLKKLSEDQLRYVNNALIQGENTLNVARTVLSWGLFTDLKEAVLARQLAKYRAYRLGTLKPEADLESVQVVGRRQRERFDAMEELRVLARQQQARVQKLLLDEDTKNVHMGLVTSEIGNYASLLKDVLKAEFDCGEREFKGPLPGGKGTQVQVIGNSIDVTLREAVESAATILARHAPVTIEGSRA